MVGAMVVMVVFTHPEPDVIRVISLRKANQNEQRSYYTQTFG